jgi:hypothetical protein
MKLTNFNGWNRQTSARICELTAERVGFDFFYLMPAVQNPLAAIVRRAMVD